MSHKINIGVQFVHFYFDSCILSKHSLSTSESQRFSFWNIQLQFLHLNLWSILCLFLCEWRVKIHFLPYRYPVLLGPFLPFLRKEYHLLNNPSVVTITICQKDESLTAWIQGEQAKAGRNWMGICLEKENGAAWMSYVNHIFYPSVQAKIKLEKDIDRLSDWTARGQNLG